MGMEEYILSLRCPFGKDGPRWNKFAFRYLGVVVLVIATKTKRLKKHTNDYHAMTS